MTKAQNSRIIIKLVYNGLEPAEYVLEIRVDVVS